MVRFPRYNMARKVLDHRVAFDYNNIRNKNMFTPGYFKGLQQFYFSHFLQGIHFYFACVFTTVATAIILTRTVVGQKNGRDSSSTFTNRWNSYVMRHEPLWIIHQVEGHETSYNYRTNKLILDNSNKK